MAVLSTRVSYATSKPKEPKLEAHQPNWFDKLVKLFRK
ncbi:hypothetical protein J2Z20_003013 [Paenibacillus sediminis]|uniref:Uncharacterized protein n=1 Tax=Paenibacillus sediminis TaxID=664909 RepID=A0ABS4H7M9_9BACL|nr:hypothetical protein [Paenibacillus sediminis]